MCTAVNFSNRVLYAMLCRLIVSFKMTEDQSMPANTDYIKYKRSVEEQNAVAADFKVKFQPRDQSMLQECFQQSQENIGDLVSGEYAESLIR